ncbi:hypothetical protein [Methanothrix sp.]|uniref:hypothetical protein n=1 Tax=Methanothrix sp. TaxID=90426 RepID=UPI003BB56EC0
MFFLLALSIATVIAEDVPFVFSKDYASIAGYSLDQIRDISMSNEDLIGVPFEAFEEYNPNLVSRVEPRNAIVRHESVLLAQKYPGNHTIQSDKSAQFSVICRQETIRAKAGAI